MRLRWHWWVALLGIALLLTGIVGARLDWWSPTPPKSADRLLFQDSFEGAAALTDLFPRDFSRWHGMQRESGARPATNRVELVSNVVHSGTNALKFSAAAYDGHTASKADVERGRLSFTKGSHVWFTGWYYLAGDADAAGVFLWDLEASRKWQSPGRRLYLQAGGWLASDLGKWWGGKTFRQSRGAEIPFPRNQWVRLKVHLLLSEGDDGTMEVWQNDKKVLDAHGQTLPTSKTVYDRLQVGLTANGNRTQSHTLYVDDVVLSNEPLD